MRSANADLFNHDAEAAGYDQDVRNEADPIRSAYQKVLAWVIAEAHIDKTSRILELGSGTGNLSRLIPVCRELVAVDVSEKMEAIAKGKLGHLPNRRFIKADVLEVFARPLGQFDSVISTYTIHHLTEDEKALLFRKTFECLSPGGRAVFGDLMVRNQSDRATKIKQFVTAGDRATAEAIRDEFFWLLDDVVVQFEALGFEVRTKQFSDLTFGIVARKTALA